MKTIKTIAVLGVVLLLATRPGNWALWAVAIGTCVAFYLVADNKENGAHQCSNTNERRAVKFDTYDCPHYITQEGKNESTLHRPRQ